VRIIVNVSFRVELENASSRSAQGNKTSYVVLAPGVWIIFSKGVPIEIAVTLGFYIQWDRSDIDEGRAEIKILGPEGVAFHGEFPVSHDGDRSVTTHFHCIPNLNLPAYGSYCIQTFVHASDIVHSTGALRYFSVEPKVR
jgi:hypothetical protein